MCIPTQLYKCIARGTKALVSQEIRIKLASTACNVACVRHQGLQYLEFNRVVQVQCVSGFILNPMPKFFLVIME